MADQKVLLVEDEILLLMTAADALRSNGVSVIEASTADEGLAILHAGPEDVAVVFSDIEASGELDGVALAAIVHARWPNTSVVLTSGRLCPTPDALPPGTTFVPKPYDLLAVSALIMGLIETSPVVDRPATGGG